METFHTAEGDHADQEEIKREAKKKGRKSIDTKKNGESGDIQLDAGKPIKTADAHCVTAMGKGRTIQERKIKIQDL